MKRLALLLFATIIFTGSQLLAAEPVYPSYSGFVNDFAGILSAGEKEKLENLSRELEKKTSAELAIVTIPSVTPLDTKEYAVKLFEKWKIGKKGKDNGILMLLAMEERRIEIEVGYGLEGVINDAKAGQILDEYVVPFFKKGEFGEGLFNGSAAIAEIIAKSVSQELESVPAARKSEEFKIPIWLIPAVIIIIILLSIFASGVIPGLLGGFFGGAIGFILAGTVGAVIGAIIGFMLSFMRGPFGGGFGGGSWGGGGMSGEGFGGGGFGGFGGGGSGGGGAGRSW